MNDRTGMMIVIAALILGACVVAGSLLVQTSVNRAVTELAGVRAAMGEMASAAPAAVAARAQRPDPNKRYKINIAGSPSVGPANAKVTLVEFSDFQCPFCARARGTLKKIEETYGNDVRVVFKHLPLRIHAKSAAAHAAAEAAHRQGKFWEMHDAIFTHQREMSPEKYVEYAEKIGLDMDQFTRDVASASVKAKIDADAKEAAHLGVTGTPGFFVNGKYQRGALPFDSFKRLIDAELKSQG